MKEESTNVLSDMVRFVLKICVHSSFYFGLDAHAAQEQEGKPGEKRLRSRVKPKTQLFAKLRTLPRSSRAETRHEYVSTCLFSIGMVAQVRNFVF